MNCNEAEILLHALLDDELDAGHAREVEAHVAGCARCAAQLRDYREMRAAMSAVDLHHAAPMELRRRLDATLPKASASAPTRRAMLQGFLLGGGVSAIAASSVAVIVFQNNQDQRFLTEVVSAHLRSLQAEHLTDVLSSDRHTVKPWFNGRLDVAPPVIDLTAQGFTLLGGRLDHIDGKPVAAIVYRRRIHVVNLFVRQAASGERQSSGNEMVQGFNIRRWTEQGLSLVAISDINAEELQEFSSKFDAALRSGG
ncbi:MAG: anti-sigma factor [Pseudomonadota bacterium]